MPENRNKDDREERGILNARAIQSGFMCIVILIVLCIVCFAWFSSHGDLTGRGTYLQVVGSRFELATRNVEGAARDVAASGTDALFELEEHDGIETNEYDIATGGGSLGLYLTDEANFGNFTAIEKPTEDEMPKLEPGDWGKITFYLHPLVNDIDVIYLDCGMSAYEVDLEATATSVTPLNDGGIADALLQGHILFFTGYNGEAASKYSGWVNGQLAVYPATDAPAEGEPRSTIVTAGAETPDDAAAAFVQDAYYEVTLYWIWPKYFTNYAYTNTDEDDLFDSTDNPDYIRIVGDMNTNDNAKRYFYNPDLVPIGPIQESPATITKVMSNADKATCTRLYNEGDQYLGVNVKYVLLRITAEE